MTTNQAEKLLTDFIQEIVLNEIRTTDNYLTKANEAVKIRKKYAELFTALPSPIYDETNKEAEHSTD